MFLSEEACPLIRLIDDRPTQNFFIRRYFKPNRRGTLKRIEDTSNEEFEYIDWSRRYGCIMRCRCGDCIRIIGRGGCLHQPIQLFVVFFVIADIISTAAHDVVNDRRNDRI